MSQRDGAMEMQLAIAQSAPAAPSIGTHVVVQSTVNHAFEGMFSAVLSYQRACLVRGTLDMASALALIAQAVSAYGRRPNTPPLTDAESLRFQQLLTFNYPL
jgi:hypothetical protein